MDDYEIDAHGEVVEGTVMKLTRELKARGKKIEELENTLQRIADALGTGETGENLIAVARDAHSAEQALAGIKRRSEGGFATAVNLEFEARARGLTPLFRDPENHDRYSDETTNTIWVWYLSGAETVRRWQ